MMNAKQEKLYNLPCRYEDVRDGGECGVNPISVFKQLPPPTISLTVIGAINMQTKE